MTISIFLSSVVVPLPTPSPPPIPPSLHSSGLVSHLRSLPPSLSVLTLLLFRMLDLFCSGGLAAYLHADRVHDILANAQAKEVTKQLQQPQQRGAAAALHSNGNAHVIAPDVDSSVSTSTGADSHNAASLKKFKTIGMSGFFLLHDNVLGDPIYQTQMKNVFEISNSSGGVSEERRE